MIKGEQCSLNNYITNMSKTGNKEMEKCSGFREAVERNAMKLNDLFFVQLTSEVLEKVSEFQHETDSESFKAKWEKNIGELVFLYNCIERDYEIYRFVRFEKLYKHDKEHYDLRFASRDSLTRSAARKMALYLFHGNGNIDDIGAECSIALMMYLRTGKNKVDFWEDFKIELMKGIVKLLGGSESLDIEESVIINLFSEEDNNILKLPELVNNTPIDYLHDENFIIFDSKIAELLKKTERYNDQEIDNAIGQYVIIKDWCSGRLFSKDKLEENIKYLYLLSLDLCSYFAASLVCEMLFYEEFNMIHVNSTFSSGVSIYKKNGLSEAEFWKNLCKELLKQLSTRRLLEEL